MTRKNRAFTLMEIMTVMGILSALMAVSMPIIRSGKGAADQYRALSAVHQLGLANSLYLSDADDTYMPGMAGVGAGHYQTWFGQIDSSGTTSTENGFLEPYIGGKAPMDPTAPKNKYLGNMGGFGYNYETLGSDLSETRDFSHFPECENPASASTLRDPSQVVAFATSVYFRPSWQKNGDDKAYDFGFVTPPWAWNGNPTVDFRHQGERKVDLVAKKVHQTGTALVLFADGSGKVVKSGQLGDKLFQRNPPILTEK